MYVAGINMRIYHIQIPHNIHVDGAAILVPTCLVKSGRFLHCLASPAVAIKRKLSFSVPTWVVKSQVFLHCLTSHGTSAM